MSNKQTILKAVFPTGLPYGREVPRWGTGGIEQAYQIAQENYDPEAVNRIMVLTDGDFNLGIMSPDALQQYVEGKRDSGVFLSLLGFGMGNYLDTTMNALANNGNGVAVYIDSIQEAKKVMVTEAQSTVFPIAKDVKLQIEFNPSKVQEYRLGWLRKAPS